jgi:hypothetical protein
VNGKLLASSCEKNRKVAGRVAAEEGLQKLKETCYTIKVGYMFQYKQVREGRALVGPTGEGYSWNEDSLSKGAS